MTQCPSTRQYLLGDSEMEHDRLVRQAALLAPHTLALFRDAGLGPGQRILDIGCGMGDVALLAAEIAGPEGEVVGADLDPASLAKARRRAEACGHNNIVFRETDLAHFIDERPFDAIVGRLVLQFMTQPVGIMRSLASVLRPGGVMIFQEANWEAMFSQVMNLPLRGTCCQFIYDSFKRSNANVDMGSVLVRGFHEIGFSEPKLRLDVPIGVAPETRRWVYDLVCAVLPRSPQYGLSTAALGDLATLSDRLELELTAHGGYATGIGLTGVWSRKPSE
jgi:SAM-dependent methyltransferase